MARQKNTGGRIRNREKMEQALELRKAGATFQAIGQALGGITKQAAFKLVEAGLAELNATCTAGAEELRRLELERLDALELALWKQRQNPRAADTLLRISERRAKLQGLDRPQLVAPTDVSGHDLPPKRDMSSLTDADLDTLADLVGKIQERKG